MNCFNCSENFESLNSFIDHFQNFHNKNFICHICKNFFYIKKSFKRHLQRVHLFSTTDDIEETVDNGYSLELNSDFVLERSSEVNFSQVKDNSISEFKLNFIKVLIKYLSKPNINRSVVFEIFQSTLEPFKNIFKEISEKVTDDELNLNEIDNFFSNDHQNISEFKLITELKNLGVWIPIKKNLLHNEISIMTVNESLAQNSKSDFFYTFDIIFFLSYLFKNDFFLRKTLNYINFLKSEKDIIYNIIQTDKWNIKINAFNSDSEKVLYLPLMIYLDDFEPLNALGSHSGAYKM